MPAPSFNPPKRANAYKTQVMEDMAISGVTAIGKDKTSAASKKYPDRETSRNKTIFHYLKTPQNVLYQIACSENLSMNITVLICAYKKPEKRRDGNHCARLFE
jgi:hypothetical protein